MGAPSSTSSRHVGMTDDEGGSSPPPHSSFPIASPSPPAATRSTRTLRSHRARNKPQAPQAKATATQAQPAASPKGSKRARATPRRANKSSSETTTPNHTSETRARRGKRSRTPPPPEDESDDGSGCEREGEGQDGSDGSARPLSPHRSRSRSLSIIPTVDMPPLTHPAPDDSAVRALGLPQSSRPGSQTLSLNRDDLIRMREGHFARARPGRKKDEDRDWNTLTMAEAAWTRLEEVGCVTKGRAWTAHEGYDDDGNPVKPDLPYVILTKLVIASSPRKMLTLNQIYQAMEERWPYFKKLGQTFRNSIRHNLSMNPAFINVERPLSEGGLGTGKGGYWKVSEDTTTSHRGRGKKPRLEQPGDSRSLTDGRSPPAATAGFTIGNPTQHMETYPHSQRPLVHMPSSFDPSSGYAHPSHISYAPPAHIHSFPAYPVPPSHYPEHCERSTAITNSNHSCPIADRDVLLSPTRSLPEPSYRRSPSLGLTRRRSSLDRDPERTSLPPLSHHRPQYDASSPRVVPALHVSPPSLVWSWAGATQSPPDHKLATPPNDGMSSLMQLATAAETDHAKTRATLAKLDTHGAPYAPVAHRLPSVTALLNGTPANKSQFGTSPRPIYG